MPSRYEFTLLPLGPDASDASDLSPRLQHCARSLYRQAWEAYREVGCPYGPTDRAMFVWYTLHGSAPGPDLVTGKN